MFTTREINVKETEFDILARALGDAALEKPTLKERLRDVAVGASLLGIFIIPIAVTAICLMFGG